MKHNYAVLRFDHYGHGDSDGQFHQATISHYKSDIDAAINCIKKEIPSIEKISILGQRFGGTLAAHIAESTNDIENLILWDPVIDGARYMQEILRVNLTTQMAVYGEVTVNRDALVEKMKQGQTVNVDGYQMSYSMYEQAAALDLKGPKQFAGNCLVIQMSKKEQPFKKELELLKNSYLKSDIRLAIELPFWREIKESYFRATSLYDETLSWLEKNNG